MNSSPSAQLKTRLAGFVLALCTLSMLIAISHHPVARARRSTEVLEAIAQVGAADRLVHGALIAIIFAMLFSFTVFTLSRARLYIGALAWVAFFAGSMSVIGAALTDGFFVPAFAERYLRTVPIDPAPGLAILNAASVTIQILTKFGFIAISAATLFWSLDLLLERGRQRLIGLLGLIISVGVGVILLFAGTVTAHSLLFIVGLQAIWYLAISYLMASRPIHERLSV